MTELTWIAVVLVTVAQVGTALHALLYKRDPRAAFGWVAICLIFPVAGPVIYYLFGINRIRMRARELGETRAFRVRPNTGHDRATAAAGIRAPELPGRCPSIARVASALEDRPLVAGNSVEPLYNGEQAYPAMLDAIHEAEWSVYLSSYIFQADETGLRFVEALDDARARNVDVRVLVDGVGAFYSMPRTIFGVLRRRGIRFARFLPPRLVPPSVSLNLRTHRKVLVADGRVAFAGGMNIGDRHLAEAPTPPARATDVHFRFTGPVVAQLERAFLDDWVFSTGDRTLPPRSDAPGEDPAERRAVCRVICDGPDTDLEKLATVLAGAAASAEHRVTIMTPYFLPLRELSAALQTAALRGVAVSVLLPATNNLAFVHWATRNTLQELLQKGVDVRYQPPPFAHGKLFLVDDHFAMVGSANLDPRSLRLNFELAVEIYDRTLNAELARHCDALLVRSRPVTYEEIEGRPLPVRLRDALFWLFSPYL